MGLGLSPTSQPTGQSCHTINSVVHTNSWQCLAILYNAMKKRGMREILYSLAGTGMQCTGLKKAAHSITTLPFVCALRHMKDSLLMHYSVALAQEKKKSQCMVNTTVLASLSPWTIIDSTHTTYHENIKCNSCHTIIKITLHRDFSIRPMSSRDWLL